MNDGSSRKQRFIYFVPSIPLEYTSDWTETCTAIENPKFHTLEDAKAECSKRDDCTMFLEKCVLKNEWIAVLQCSSDSPHEYYFCEKGSDKSDVSYEGKEELYRKRKCRCHDLLDIIFVYMTFVVHFQLPPNSC